MDLLGQTIGQYQLVELISESDKNLVYKGIQAETGRDVAVKVLSPSQTNDPQVVQQFQQEIQLITAVKHPNVLPVYDYGQHNNLLYMVTAYVAGSTLAGSLPQYRSLPMAQQMVSSIAAALDYVHEQGIVHGNLKPANILIEPTGKPYLTDFGAFQNMGQFGISNPFRSPEQAQGGLVDRRTDNYALGVLLFEMVTGAPPPVGVVPSPRLERPDLPSSVEQVILKAMAQDPDQRYQTAGEFSGALNMALSGQPGMTAAAGVAGAAVVPPSNNPPSAASPAPAAPQQDNTRLKWIAGGVVAVALLLGLACAAVFLFDMLGSGGEGESGGGGIIVVIPTPAPAVPSVTARTDTDIFAGPGPVYEKVGVLRAGQSAEAVGRSADDAWWVIKVTAIANSQGWVSASDVNATNTGNLPVIQPPPPPSPTATPDVSEPQPPAAAIDGNTQAQVGQTVNFTGRRSEAAPGSQIVSYEWNFDDGTAATGIDVSHMYESSGTYNVSLTVTDNNDLSNTTRLQVQISDLPPSPEPDQPPVAVINAPSKADIGETVSLDANSSVCAGACVSYAWDLGDGTTANAVVINHVYNSSGIFNVILVVTDDKGLQGTTNIQIDVTQPEPDQPPTAVINAPNQANAGGAVTFDGSASQPGSSPIEIYNWDFGDGNTARGATVNYTYSNPGDYEVTLLVIDQNELRATTTHQIQITAGEPPPEDSDLEGRNWGLDNTIEGTTITALFQGGTVSGSGGCNTYSATYQLDGTSLNITSPPVVGQEACEEAIMNQETAYLTALSGASSYQVRGSQMTISGAQPLSYAEQ